MLCCFPHLLFDADRIKMDKTAKFIRKGVKVMNRSEMITVIAERVGISRKEVSRVLDELNDVTVEALKKGEKVTLSGFGSFELRVRSAHTGHNPRTGEQIEVKETRTVAFRPGKVLKAAVMK